MRNKLFLIGFLKILTLNAANAALRQSEEIEFIKLASTWRKGHTFPIEDCLFYNFGYEKELPYAQINLNLDEEIDISLVTTDIEAPSGCSIVLIAGKYARQVDAVMKKMDGIAEAVQFVPLVTFIFDQHANIDSSLRF